VRDDRRYRYLQDQWREHLGIEIAWQWRSSEFNDYVKQLATHPPNLFIMGWAADYPDPDNVLRVALHQQNVPRWHNPQYEQLLNAAQRPSRAAQVLSSRRSAVDIGGRHHAAYLRPGAFAD